MKITATLVLLVAALGESSGQAMRPVVIGLAGPDFDACTSLGVTTHAVHLRTGPGTEYPSVRVLPEGTPIHLCGPMDSGRWESVVLATDEGVDCGVSSPVADPVEYAGPCVSGWISRLLFKVTAG